jgi:hypothetical protein
MPKRKRSVEEPAASSKRQQSLGSQPPKTDDRDPAGINSASTSGSSPTISDAIIRTNGDDDTQDTTPPAADLDMVKGTVGEVRAPAEEDVAASAELVRLRKELEFKDEVTRFVFTPPWVWSSESMLSRY